MKQGTSKKKAFLGYCCYCIVVLVALLYYLFPSDAVKAYLEARFAETVPAYRLHVKDVRPAFPPGLTVTRGSLSLTARPERSLLEAKSFMAGPDFTALVRGRHSYRFSCSAYGGGAEGGMSFPDWSLKGPVTAEVRMEGIRLEDSGMIEELLGRKLSGALGGTLSFKGDYGNVLGGSGDADLMVSSGTVQLLQPVFGLEYVNFNSVGVKAALKNRTITLSELELTSAELKGTLSGSIVLSPDLKRSAVNLRGNVEPFAAFFGKDGDGAGAMELIKGRLKKGKLYFSIRGTLGEPKFSLT